MAVSLLPYYGKAPLAANLWGRWNFAPSLLASLFALGAFCWGWSGRVDRSRYLTFGLGYIALVAFLSPLCALKSGLFAVRSAHHLLLVAIAAPAGSGVI